MNCWGFRFVFRFRSSSGNEWYLLNRLDSGYFIDAQSAEAISSLAVYLILKLILINWEERAEETKEMLAKLQQMEQDIINKAITSSSVVI